MSFLTRLSATGLFVFKNRILWVFFDTITYEFLNWSIEVFFVEASRWHCYYCNTDCILSLKLSYARYRDVIWLINSYFLLIAVRNFIRLIFFWYSVLSRRKNDWNFNYTPLLLALCLFMNLVILRFCCCSD